MMDALVVTLLAFVGLCLMRHGHWAMKLGTSVAIGVGFLALRLVLLH
jgi:hypothetical protein